MHRLVLKFKGAVTNAENIGSIPPYVEKFWVDSIWHYEHIYSILHNYAIAFQYTIPNTYFSVSIQYVYIYTIQFIAKQKDQQRPS